MSASSAGIIFSTLHRIYRLLPSDFRFKALITLLLLLINSALDVAGLGVVVPLVMILLDDQAIAETPILKSIYEFSGFSTERMFIGCICLIIVIFVAAKNLISLWILNAQARFVYGLEAYFSQNLYRAFYTKGLMFIKKVNSASVLRNINSVPQAFTTSILLPTLQVLNELMIVSFIIVALIIYQWQVVLLLSAVMFPSIWILYRIVRHRSNRYAERLHEISPSLAKVLFESIYGYIDVKISNTELLFFKRHERLHSEMKQIQTKALLIRQLPPKFMELSLFMGIVLIVLYGIFFLEQRSALLPLLGVFALAAYRVMPSVNRLLSGVTSIKGYQYALDVIEKDEARNATQVPIAHIHPMKFEHSITLENIHFSYSGNEHSIIRGVDLTIHKGEVVGFVGKSGSGKTTIMNLMLGFLKPDQGFVRVDGQEVSATNLNGWRSIIGFVQQDVFIMDDTLRANVAFGIDSEDIDDTRVEWALNMARLGDVVSGLDKGIYARVGERGGNLSGGQRQRIGIARALFSGAKVLFFDEATSSLDNETEREITEAIHALHEAQYTMIIVAHRLTTLKYCDRIFEIENGKVVSETTYDSLLKESH